VQENEECDDGNLADNDGCSAACVAEACGDGIVNNGEACDDGNLVDNDGCSADCALEFTGGAACAVAPRSSAVPLLLLALSLLGLALARRKR
jgi:cysteine-rich repeat protein